MLRTTAGQLAVNESLPEELRDYDRVLDGKGVKELMQRVADQHPDRYRQVVKALSDVGREMAYATGGFSFGLRSLRPAKSYQIARREIQAEIDAALADPELDDAGRRRAVMQAVWRQQKPLEAAIYKEALENQNPLAIQVLSGSRGKPMNLKSLLGADLLYQDHRDQAIPLPVLNGYGQGLTPAEYFAGTFGARKGTIDTKFATQNAGFFGKQLNQAAHRLVVTAEDGDEPGPDAAPRGLPVDTDDPDSAGALLSVPAGGYPRNTHLTPRVLKDLQARGVKRVVARSPIIGGPADGGLYGRDLGVRERGGVSPVGDMVGVAGGQAVSEPINQGGLCLAEGTLVRMADWSARPVEEVKAGEFVMGSDREANLFPVRVVRAYDNGLRECVRTEFSVASTRERIELVSTPDHKLLGEARYWAPDTELCEPGVYPVGHRCVRLAGWMPRSVTNDRGGVASEPFALLLGLLLGDGCYTPSVHGVHLSCFDPSLIQDITQYLTTLGLKAKLLAGQRGYYRISQLLDSPRFDPATGQTLPGDRNPALIALKRYRMYGKYAHEKTIPEEIWSWHQESVLRLLSGLFVTDGSIYTSRSRVGVGSVYVNFASTSAEMANQVRELLRVRLAVHAGPVHATGSGRKRLLYGFTVTRRSDVLRLLAVLPLYGVKRRTADRLLAEWRPVQERDGSRYYRKSQIPVGEVPTYDLEVDHPDHLFVLANGLIVSNSSKHSGGVAGAGKTVSGFKALNQMVQVPKTYPGGAAHAEADGTVDAVVDAPAGGKYVTVGGKRHYVATGFDLLVKPGDKVEAGDAISEGLPNPAKVVQHKGVGEGRRYFVYAFRRAMKDAGLSAERRNLELVARGLINHVRVTEEFGDHLPGDVVPYDTLEAAWEPRPTARRLAPASAVGKYLERPVLHHSVGTRVTRGMLADLDEFGVKGVDVSDDPPPFEPEMVRGMENLQHDSDWMARMLGSNLEKSLLGAVHRGADSDEAGTSYVPALANPVNFGRTGLIRGFKPSDVKPPPAPAAGGVLAGLGGLS